MLRGFESLSCHSTKAPSGGRGLRRSGNWAGEGGSAAQDLGAGLRALFRADDAALVQVVELAQALLDRLRCTASRTARRSPVHCAENLGYPHRILNVLQPRYLAWGPGL